MTSVDDPDAEEKLGDAEARATCPSYGRLETLHHTIIQLADCEAVDGMPRRPTLLD